MPEINIPEIDIPEIIIPNIHIPNNFSSNYEHSNVKVIGCKYYHRDTKNTGNRNLLIDDPRGVTSDCPFPSFNPLQYVPDQLIIVEEAAPVSKEPDTLPEGKPPQAEIPKKDKKEDVFVECPGKKDQKIGDYRNEKRISRVSGHLRSEDGTECITLYENVTFIDSVLPSPSAALNVVTISLIATSSSLLIPAIKSLSKTAFKKIFAKFDKKKTDKEKR